MGRTGTKFLAKLLSRAFDGVDARHEPSPDLFHLGTGYIRSKITLKKAQSQLQAARTHICEQMHRAGCDYYVEANNNLAYLIPVIRKIFPDYRIIHIVRDGRECVRSSYSKTVTQRGRRRSEVLFMSEQDHRRRLQAIDLPDDPYHARWPHMDRFERMCWYWVKKDSVIRDALLNDERAITVRFDTIFDENKGYQGLWDIIEFLNLRERISLTESGFRQLLKTKENRTQKYLIPHWSEWTSRQKEQFREIAGEHMELYGYEF